MHYHLNDTVVYYRRRSAKDSVAATQRETFLYYLYGPAVLIDGE